MRKILCVSQLFPPSPSTRAVQTHRVLSGLHAHGYWPVVYCEETRANFDPAVPDRSNLDYAVRPSSSLWRFELFRKIMYHLPMLGVELLGVPRWSFPCWNAGVCCRGLFMRRERFDLILTISTPVADHLTGYLLKKRLAIPWAAFFSDPWIASPAMHEVARRYLGIHRAVKKKIFDNADLLIFVTDETRDRELEGFSSQHREKSCVIPHGFYPRFAEVVPLAPAADSQKTLFRYIGMFTPPRTPEPIMAGIAAAKRQQPDIERHFQFELIGRPYAGMTELKNKYMLGTELLEIPAVRYSESLGYMKGADVLVHVDGAGETNLFLASKLVEYIGAGKPILGITLETGTAAALIRDARGFVASRDCAEAIGACIRDVVQKKLNRQLDEHTPTEQLTACYHTTQIAQRYASAFDQILRLQPQ
jgi:hypothetical protein